MFGSIGQPVSGVKNKQTARVFLSSLRDEAASRQRKQRRSRRRRQRFYRAVKGWLTRQS